MNIPYIYIIKDKDSYLDNYFWNLYALEQYLLLGFIIVCIIFLASYIIIKKNSYFEKLMPYECGFEPYADARNIVDIQFYLVALLFLVFDLESLYLYPLVVGLKSLDIFSFYILIDFFIELFIGYLIIYKYILKNILVN